MKARNIVALCLAIVGISLTACAKGGSKNQNQEANMEGKKTVLVAYFSATGTTKAVAERLAKQADADLFTIEPAQPYTTEDLDWTNDKSRTTLEMKDEKSRPAIKNKVEDMAQYQTIYLGFPVWWYTAPHIIRTFLESYNLEGKTIIPFATSGGSDIDKVHEQLRSEAPKANWKQGRLLNGASDADLKQWVESLK